MLHRTSLLGLAFALPLTTACGEKDVGAVDDTGPDVLDDDCPVDAGLFEEVRAEVATVPTVIRTSWRASAPVEARVAYADTTTGEVFYTPLGGAETTGAVNVVGLLPNRDITLQVEATVAGERRCSPTMSARTGSLPSELPATVLTVNDAARAVRGWHSVAVVRETSRFATILDADGQFVWALAVPDLFRATLSRDHRSMLTNEPPKVWNEVGRLHRFSLDGDTHDVIEVVGGHTDFVELPDGTLATLGWVRKSFEGDTRHLLGDTIVEVRPDGTQVVVWDIFDHIEPFLGTTYAPSPVSGADEPLLEEWSHVNSISYDEASDDYVVTGSFNHAVMRIDRGTGAMVWTLTDGNNASDWVVASDQREIELPHSAQLVDEDTVLAFSRGPLGSEKTPAGCAWVTELALDPTTGVATPTWHYDGGECITVPVLGQARRIAEGNTLFNWTFAGRVSQTDAAGVVVYQVDLPLGTAFGSGEWSASLY